MFGILEKSPYPCVGRDFCLVIRRPENVIRLLPKHIFAIADLFDGLTVKLILTRTGTLVTD